MKTIPPIQEYRNRAGSVRILSERPSRTPDFQWEILPDAPVPRYDAAAIQVGPLLYCIGGYSSLDEALSLIDIFDMEHCRWSGRIAVPPEVPQTHVAVACEAGRFFYFAGGQLGPQCKPAVADVFVLDITDQVWRNLPPLPAPRYAPTMQIWQGRLHLVGGAKEDRYTPLDEHWSLGVSGGQATENEWRREVPIPRGGMHRACAVVNEKFLVLGGQEGDFIAVPNDPCFACDGKTIEHIYADVYQWNGEEQNWQRLPDMPVTSSHTEFSVTVAGDVVYLAGGSKDKDRQTFAIELTDVVQAFDARTQSWSIAGYLPFRSKTSLTAIYNGWLYVTCGQRDQGPHSPKPGVIERRTWRARLL